MMKDNFALLLTRIIDCHNSINYPKMIKSLERIKQSCICIGVGGSQAASHYASKYLILK